MCVLQGRWARTARARHPELRLDRRRVWTSGLWKPLPTQPDALRRRHQSEWRCQAVQVVLADLAQRHQRAADPEAFAEGPHRDLAALEQTREQPSYGGKGRAHD